MTKTNIYWTVGACGVLGCCGCFCLPDLPEARPLFYLFFGWAFYLVRIPVSAFLPWVVVSAVGMFLTTLGAHLAGQQIWRDPTWPWRRSLGIGAFVGLMLIVGVAANDGLFHLSRLGNDGPIIEYHRGASPRMISINNLKQIGLGTHGHHDSLKHLPLGGTFDEQGRGLHGWQTMILPYVDQPTLFKQIRLKQAWNSPANAEWMKAEIAVYQHPSINHPHADRFAASHYAGNVHVLGPMKMKLDDITDGASNTILTGEVASNFKPWGSPTNWRDPGLGLHTHADGFGGPSPGVTVIGFADGTVRSVRNDASPQVLKALSTPRGGEKVLPDDLDR